MIRRVSKLSWFSYVLSALLLISCSTVPTPPPTQAPVMSAPRVATQQAQNTPLPQKEKLTLSQPMTGVLGVPLSGFQLQGEDKIGFELPLSLPISRSGIKEGTGMLYLSGGNESWNAADLVTARFSIVPQTNGTTLMRLEAGKSSGPSTYYVSASGIVNGVPELKEGSSISAPLNFSESKYSISNDNTGGSRNYVFESGVIQASVNGEQITVGISGMTSSRMTWKECFSWGTGSACYDRSDSTKSLLGGNIQFISPIAKRELSLELKADQDGIGNTFASESGELALQSVLGVDTFGSLEPWTLRIKKEGATGTATGDSCWDSYTSSGTGKKDNAYTLDATKLGNGTYTVEAYYSAYPDEKATVTVKVDNQAFLYAIPSSFKPGEEVTTLTTFVPPCTGKTTAIYLSGQAWSPLNPAVPEQRCVHPGFSVGPGLQNTVWDGLCEDLAGKGDWVATLVSETGDILKSTGLNLRFDIVVPPPPTPTPEPTVEPSVEPTVEPSPEVTPTPELEIGRCDGAPCPVPTNLPPKTPRPERTPQPRPTEKPSKPEKPDDPFGGGQGQACQTEDNQVAFSTLIGLESLLQVANADIQHFSNIVDQRNFLAYQQGSFQITAKTDKKPKKNTNQPDKISAYNQEINDLYFNILDELRYLQEDQQVVKNLYFSHTGQVIPEPNYQAEPFALANALHQAFKDSQKDETLVTELAVVYQEMALLRYLAQDLLNKEVHSKNRSRLIHILRDRIKQHNHFIYKNPLQLEPVPADTAQTIEQWVQAFESAQTQMDSAWQQIEPLVNQGFSTQQVQSPQDPKYQQALETLLKTKEQSDQATKEMLNRLQRIRQGSGQTSNLAQLKTTLNQATRNLGSLQSTYRHVSQQATRLATLASAAGAYQQAYAFRALAAGATLSGAVITGTVAALGATVYLTYLSCELDNATEKKEAINDALTEALVETARVIAKTKTQTCQIYGDAEKLEQIIQYINLSNENNSMGSIHRQVERLENLKGKKAIEDAYETLLASIEHYTDSTLPEVSRKIDEECEPGCPNGEPAITLNSSKALQKALREISGHDPSITRDRVIASEDNINDIARLLSFYGGEVTNFYKYSTGERQGEDTFFLEENVWAPYGYQGAAEPKLGLFCQGDEVEAHWYQYKGKKATTTLQPNQKFEYKLKCYDGECLRTTQP